MSWPEYDRWLADEAYFDSLDRIFPSLADLIPIRESSPRATSPTSHTGPVARGHLLPTARGEDLARGSTATLADPASSWGQPARGYRCSA